MNKRRFRRVLAFGDTHCGHLYGLTPPDWQRPLDASDGIGKIQEAFWNDYCAELESIKPIDTAFFLGDAIEGKGERSGGTENVTADRIEQIAMAARCIEQVGAKNLIMVYGTPYHTGADEDWEAELAKKVKATKIGSHEWVTIGPTTFDLKHFVSGSSIPHGRGTSLARDRLWNALWADRQEQPRASVFIRAHVHYHTYVGEHDWVAMTLPALQLARTKYGARRHSGTVTSGFVSFDVNHTGAIPIWRAHILRKSTLRPISIIL